MVAVSSCLAGIVCRYNAEDIYNADLMNSIGDDWASYLIELRNSRLWAGSAR